MHYKNSVTTTTMSLAKPTCLAVLVYILIQGFQFYVGMQLFQSIIVFNKAVKIYFHRTAEVNYLTNISYILTKVTHSHSMFLYIAMVGYCKTNRNI